MRRNPHSVMHKTKFDVSRISKIDKVCRSVEMKAKKLTSNLQILKQEGNRL